MDASKPNLFFKRIDMLFWLIWIALPFCIAASMQYWDKAIIFSNLEDGCTGTTSKVLSDQGKIAAGIFFALDNLIYIVLFGIMHKMVRACAKGEFFMQTSITAMGYIAGIVIIWPIVALGLFNIVAYYLYSIGDIASFKLEYHFDALMLGAGFFFLVLRAVLKNALALYEDAKLTI